MPPKIPTVDTATAATPAPTGIRKITIVLTRALKITIGETVHDLQKGVNLVEKAVAEHWLVKPHSLDASNMGADSDLSAQIVVLQNQLDAANAVNADLQAQLDIANGKVDASEASVVAATAKVDELQTMIDAFLATSGDKK